MSILQRLLFNLWYYRQPPWDTGLSPPELLDFIADHPPGRALDLGCGTGTNVLTLAKNGWQATGVDFAPRAIQSAHHKASKAEVTVNFQVADVTRLDGLAGPFDLILDMGCFHSLSDKGKGNYVQNLHRLLATQGTYLMYGFFKSASGTGPGLVQADLDLLTERLQLVDRQDGMERDIRPAAWFRYTRGTE